MNEKSKSDSFRHRVFRYLVITAVIQVVLFIMFLLTAPLHGDGDPPLLAGYFLLLLTNFALWSITDIGYPIAMIAGTFFMFLIVLALGEIYHHLPPPRSEGTRRQEYHE